MESLGLDALFVFTANFAQSCTENGDDCLATFLLFVFCRSYAPWNLENIRKSTNNLSFLRQFFINEITASDAGPDIIRSHLFMLNILL